MNRASAVALKSHTPSSVAPYLIFIRTYSANGIWIGLAEVVTEIKLLERAFIPLLDSFPTVNRSRVGHKNRFLCEECGHGSGIVIVFGVIKFRNERMKLLYCFWISRVFLYCYHCSPLVFFGTVCRAERSAVGFPNVASNNPCRRGRRNTFGQRSLSGKSK